MAALLAAGADANAKESIRGRHPLYIAARKGHADCVRLLLQHGANPDALNEAESYAREGGDETALHTAAQKGHAECVRVLLEHGASPNARNRDEDTPLMLAVTEGKVDAVRALLEGGADVNASSVGYIPAALHAAIYFKQPECLRLLLEHGADVNAEFDYTDNAMTFAEEHGDEETLVLLREYAGKEEPTTKEEP